MGGDGISPPVSFLMNAACVFVDGENLRYALRQLIPKEFDSPDSYLPRHAHWANFFNELAKRAGAESRLRTYWYVVEQIEFFPQGKWWDRKDLEDLLGKQNRFKHQFAKAIDLDAKTRLIQQIANEMQEDQTEKVRYFQHCRAIQDSVVAHSEAVEFRRSGCISYNLLSKNFGKEKAVDVQLAVDLLEFRNMYQVAVIVSGDQDFVPAVQVAKNSGKRVVNVNFVMRNGNIHPSGSRRLSLATDHCIQINHSELVSFMGFEAER